MGQLIRANVSRALRLFTAWADCHFRELRHQPSTSTPHVSLHWNPRRVKATWCGSLSFASGRAGDRHSKPRPGKRWIHPEWSRRRLAVAGLAVLCAATTPLESTTFIWWFGLIQGGFEIPSNLRFPNSRDLLIPGKAFRPPPTEDQNIQNQSLRGNCWWLKAIRIIRASLPHKVLARGESAGVASINEI